MTTVCPSCGARSTPPTPVPGEANTTEAWVHHETGCAGPESQSDRLARLLFADEPADNEPAVPGCGCSRCQPLSPFMVVCALCGNKRCPHASDHRFACTQSNEWGQAGRLIAAKPYGPKPTKQNGTTP